MPGPDSKEYRLVSPTGEVVTVKGAKELAARAAKGWRMETAEEGASRAAVAGEKERYKPSALGVADRVISGLTAGGSDFLRGALGNEYDREDLHGRKEALGTAGTVIETGTGVLASLGGSGVLGQGVKRLATATPVGALSRGATAITEREVLDTGARALAKKAANFGAGTFLEGSAQTVGNNLGAYGRGEIDLDAESLMADAASGGAANALTGGILTGGAALAQKGRKFIAGRALTAGKAPKPADLVRASDDVDAAVRESLGAAAESRAIALDRIEKKGLIDPDLAGQARAIAKRRAAEAAGIPEAITVPEPTIRDTAAPEAIAADVTERGGDASINAALDRANRAPAGPAPVARVDLADAPEIHVPGPDGVTPFQEAMAELDAEAGDLVGKVRASWEADQPLIEAFNPITKRPGPAAPGLDAIGPDTSLWAIGRAMDEADEAGRLAILQQVGPEKARQAVHAYSDQVEMRKLLDLGHRDAVPTPMAKGSGKTERLRRNADQGIDPDAVDDAIGPSEFDPFAPRRARGDDTEIVDPTDPFRPSYVPRPIADDPWARGMGLSAAEADDIAHSSRMFDSIGSHEDAGAALARSLGPDAPEAAQRLALARDLATDDQSRRAMRRMAQLGEDASAVPEYIPGMEGTVRGLGGVPRLPGRNPSAEEVFGPLPGAGQSPLKRRLRDAGFREPVRKETYTTDDFDLEPRYANEAEFQKAMEGFDIAPGATGAGRKGAHPPTMIDFNRPGRSAEVMDAVVPLGRQARGSLSSRMRDQGFEVRQPGRVGDGSMPAPRLAPVSGEMEAASLPSGSVGSGLSLDPSLARRSGYRGTDIAADLAGGRRAAQRGRLGEVVETAAKEAGGRLGAGKANGKASAKGGILSTLADAGAVLKGLQAVGVQTGFDPDKIPLIGPVLGPYLKLRGLMMAGSKLGLRVPATGPTLARARAVKVRNGMYKAVDKLLAGTGTALKAGGVVAGSQAWRLRDVLDKPINPEAVETAKRKTLASDHEAAMERAEEARAAAANPEAVARAVRLRFPDDSDPDLVDAVIAVEQRRNEYLAKNAPQAPPSNLFRPSKWEMSMGELVKWGRRLRASRDPRTVYEDIANGSLSTEAAEAFREVYPTLYQATRSYLVEQQAELNATLAPEQVANLSVLFRVALRPGLDGETMQRLQEAGGAQPAAPAPPGMPGPQIPMNGQGASLAPAYADPVYRGPGQ